MKIRSITCFINPRFPFEAGELDAAGGFLVEARQAFEEAGYEVQTARLATIPFPNLFASQSLDKLPELACTLEGEAQNRGFDHLALGPALPGQMESYRAIPEAVAATRKVSFSGVMAMPGLGVCLPAVRECAGVIHGLAGLEPGGFANMRFAALANVPPGAPFFPAAYHQGDDIAFALACEAADLAVQAFSEARSLDEGRQRLLAALEDHGRTLVTVAAGLAAHFRVNFGGIDFSLAPFPEAARSLGYAMERLGVPAAGLHGSLAAAAILAETLDRAKIPRAGFSGLMLPVLEDAILAARAAEGALTIKDLLLYSAVCGTGLDTIPLPGDTSQAAITALLLDLAVLSERLSKPLTARLMPIPGKAVGDPTDFDFAYFANSRVLALAAQPLGSFLVGDESFTLVQRG